MDGTVMHGLRSGTRGAGWARRGFAAAGTPALSAGTLAGLLAAAGQAAAAPAGQTAGGGRAGNGHRPAAGRAAGRSAGLGVGGGIHHIAVHLGTGKTAEAWQSGTRVTVSDVRPGGDHAGAVRVDTASQQGAYSTWGGTNVWTHAEASVRDARVHRCAGPTSVRVACRKHTETVTAEGYTHDASSYLPDYEAWITNIRIRGAACLPGWTARHLLLNGGLQAAVPSIRSTGSTIPHPAPYGATPQEEACPHARRRPSFWPPSP